MKRSSANLLLLLAALIWGTTFVAQFVGMNGVGPFTFTATRFVLGSLVILPLAWKEYARLRRAGIHPSRKDLLRWISLGVVLCLGVNLQQVGLLNTTVSNAGFLTALYVPLVPMLSWLLYRERIHPATWPAVIGCLLGTFLLSGGQLAALNEGDMWILSSTFFWTLHVVWIGRFADRIGSPIMVALTQFMVCGLLSWIPALSFETLTMQGLTEASPAILYAGILSVGIAYTLQVVAQRHTVATDAAILLSAEMLFAAIAGAVVLGDRLSPLQLIGGLLIFLSILAVQLLPVLFAESATQSNKLAPNESH